MDSLAAAPGTGPATSPLPILRKPRPAARFADLPADRTLVMGILNVTPDSFSDGGKHPTADTAIAHALRMLYAGADIIDVGGESTRPGAEPVSPEEEQRRVLPVIQALVKAGALVSIDTTHASTAAAAVEAGAAIINDVSG
ncbi:dihydropteroate synthase [Arthrobacter sp. Hiyo1]|nr:dihydropteroate synthase [Arthrobacter sp. Hiyo1]